MPTLRHAAPTLALLLAAALPAGARAQLPTLHGATLFEADAAGNNDLAPGHEFRGAWRTNPGIFFQYHNVFLTDRADAAFSPAGVYPNGGPDFLQVPLALGTNTFWFYASGVDRVNPGPFWGLNLWLGTGPQSACGDAPDISAVVAPGAGPAAAATGATTTTQCLPPSNWIPGAGTLSTTSNGYAVTLSDFALITAGDAPGAPDRVGPTAAAPDGVGDSYGTFTLDVVAISAVPEPTSVLLLGVGLVALGAVARRRRTR